MAIVATAKGWSVGRPRGWFRSRHWKFRWDPLLALVRRAYLGSPDVLFEQLKPDLRVADAGIQVIMASVDVFNWVTDS